MSPAYQGTGSRLNGGEVVNASIAEWFNYTTYERLREAKKELTLSLKQFHFDGTKTYLKAMIKHGAELWYQQKKKTAIESMQ